MNKNPKHILIADDHGVVRYGIMLLIKDLMPWSTVSQVGSFNETLNLVTNNKIDLIILDINLPGGNNIQMLSQLSAVQKSIKVLMFSAYEENLYAERYMKAGAKGYLHKQTCDKEIKKAIETVLSGGIYMSELVKDLMVHKMLNNDDQLNPSDILSNREFEVAQLIINGLGVTEIASTLNLQLSTVSTYKNRIFEKLNLTNIVQLIDKFRSWNIPSTN